MKEVKLLYFVTYVESGQEKTGVLNQAKTRVFSLNSILGDLGYSMLDLIALEETPLNTIRSFLNNHPGNVNDSLAISDLKILAPIPRLNRNVICLGLNYSDHVKESVSIIGPKKDPEQPVFFTKSSTYVIGPDAEIDSHPEVTNELDYEVELAVVIGKKGTNIAIEQAMDYIYGYTILNDITARDVQRRHGQWMKGKSLDSFTAMGPYLVHASAIENPGELDILSRVNGELRQNSNTRFFIFDLSRIISELSLGFTLMPGDVISTRTPSGVGMGFNPPRYLKSGDVVECTIEGIGTLKNVVK